MNERVIFHADGSVTISEDTYNKICLKVNENSITYFYMMRKLEKNIERTIKYLEKKRIRNKAIIDVDVVEGMLNE